MDLLPLTKGANVPQMSSKINKPQPLRPTLLSLALPSLFTCFAQASCWETTSSFSNGKSAVHVVKKDFNFKHSQAKWNGTQTRKRTSRLRSRRHADERREGAGDSLFFLRGGSSNEQVGALAAVGKPRQQAGGCAEAEPRLINHRAPTRLRQGKRRRVSRSARTECVRTLAHRVPPLLPQHQKSEEARVYKSDYSAATFQIYLPN